MTCLILILTLTFCEPDDNFLVKQYVDNSVGLYFREYVYKGREIVTTYQLAGTDLKDDAVDVLPMPFMVTINRQPYMVACFKERCFLQRY
jgi:hypothetical protein